MPESLSHNGLTLVVERPQSPAAGIATARPPLLLVPGLFAGAWVFDRWQRLLADRGWTSYALDLRGHYGSRPVPDFGATPMADFVADALEAAAWLHGVHGEKPMIVGHSMGGLLAQKVAEAGAVQAAVFLCAAPPRGISALTLRLLGKMVSRAGALAGGKPIMLTLEEDADLALNKVTPGERSAIHARMVPESGRAARDLALGAVQVDAQRVTCPVVCVSSAEDRFVVPSVGRKLARKYHAPWWLEPGHGHFLVQEPGWEVPAGDVERWLAHVAERLRTPAVDDALWRRLKEGIGDIAELTFFDGHAVRAELISVDLAARQNVVFAPVETRRIGARARYLAHEQDEEQWSPLVEITDVRVLSDV
jgi:non-heme chloroperoxidase